MTGYANPDDFPRCAIRELYQRLGNAIALDRVTRSPSILAAAAILESRCRLFDEGKAALASSAPDISDDGDGERGDPMKSKWDTGPRTGEQQTLAGTSIRVDGPPVGDNKVRIPPRAVHPAPPRHPPRTVQFLVAGQPMAKGDHTVANVGGKTWLREKNAGVKSKWRDRAADVAREARGSLPMFDEPLRVKLVVLVLHPLSHFTANLRDRGLKASAPRWPSSKPDLDKLQRSLGDALQGVLWRDDSQISTWLVMRRWADEIGILVEVTPEAEFAEQFGKRSRPEVIQLP